MGNCQAVDAAALVIQHPNGQQERMYWPVSASEVMKMNPGHYVSLIIPLPVDGERNSDDKTVRFTRVKLLRPTDTLVLGRAYRLVTTQEVTKVLRAKKHAKMKTKRPDSAEQTPVAEMQNRICESETGISAGEKNDEPVRHDSHRQRSGSTNLTAIRSKTWRPSLQSISESGS
ncbi:uncharacterized protein LOC111406353 [Olea europaea var. sylvestris]|uniref:DUF4228 domain-containing protein n=1 Tax=Olea europaea subsp. europaea TaxID=158383 RepID=A0A8S0PNK4_OLEEU|nr:uncharacterized protein LOC111406353 [Olea europaea var. sylvestris]CAA2954369.1 Hypothetical predicted protein [Olea europaea subsp. europaea]